MRTTLAAILLMAAPAVAFAQSTQPPAPTPAPSENLRNITIRNRAKQDVVEAHATVSNKGDVLATTKGKIAPDEILSFQLDRSQCVQGLSVRFTDGRTESSPPITNCQTQQFTVFDDHITGD